MLIENRLLILFNQQLRNELESAYKYLGMAAYLETTPFHGMAHWMRKQSTEELSHGMKFFDFINSRGNHVELADIAAQPTRYSSPLEAFRAALKHERLVTSLINELYTLALELNDYASQEFLRWFISEQVEEEAGVTTIIDQLEAVENSQAGLLVIDRMLAKRED